MAWASGDTVTSAKLNYRGGNIFSVKDPAYGATGDGSTDDAASIRLADQAAGGNGTGLAGIVFFPRGDYVIGSQITKEPHTTWVGVTGYFNNIPDDSEDRDYEGTILRLGFDGTMINNPTQTPTAYSGNGGIRNMFMRGNMSLYPNSIAINYVGGLRRQVYEDLYINGFKTAVNGSLQEHYYNRCFFSGGWYGLFAQAGADLWLTNCHMGSGLGATGVTEGTGIRLVNCNNVVLQGCRGQTQENGQGYFLDGCTNVEIVGGYADSNEQNGIQIQNSQKIFITAINSFDNGTTGANKAGIQMQTTKQDITSVSAAADTITIASHGVQNIERQLELTTTDTLPGGLAADTVYYPIRVDANTLQLASTRTDAADGTAINITDTGTGTHTVQHLVDTVSISNSLLRDRNAGSAAEAQATGVAIAKVSSGGFLRNISIQGTDFNGVTTPTTGESSVSSGLVVRNNLGYVTENSGTATVTNGTTLSTISHGLGKTPTNGDIVATPIETLNNASFFWVSGLSSNGFVINVNGDPGQDVDFGWQAIIL
jgi:hypothetical protein